MVAKDSGSWLFWPMYLFCFPSLDLDDIFSRADPHYNFSSIFLESVTRSIVVLLSPENFSQ